MPPKRGDPLQWLSSTRLVIVAGKGGVGKTTVTAVLARAAFHAGRRVLAVEMDGKPALAALLPADEGNHTMTVTPSDALSDYLDTHGFTRMARKLAGNGLIDVVATAAPGIDDIVVLGKLKQLERRGDYDLILVDGPAAGHAITMLMAPAGLQAAVRSGPIRHQADEVRTMLTDPTRAQVVLVTLAETTPVNELLHTAAQMRERIDIRFGPAIVNAVDSGGPLKVPARLADQGLVAAAAFTNARRAVQHAEVARLRAAWDGACLELPRISGFVDAAAVDALARGLGAPGAGR